MSVPEPVGSPSSQGPALAGLTFGGFVPHLCPDGF